MHGARKLDQPIFFVADNRFTVAVLEIIIQRKMHTVFPVKSPYVGKHNISVYWRIHSLSSSLLSRYMSIKKQKPNCFQTYLARRLNAFDDTKVRQQPGNHQGHSQLPVYHSAFLDPVSVHQRLAVVIVGSGATPGAFFGYCQLCGVQLAAVTRHLWTLGPRKRRLERVEEVEQHPGYNHVVVAAN